MFSVLPSIKYYFYSHPVDMRKSFNGLYLLVMNELSLDELPYKMFLFLNKSRNKLKVLYWDTDGFAIWYKSLEKGFFIFPASGDKYMKVSPENLSFILQGIDINSIKKMKRINFKG